MCLQARRPLFAGLALPLFDVAPIPVEHAATVAGNDSGRVHAGGLQEPVVAKLAAPIPIIAIRTDANVLPTSLSALSSPARTAAALPC